MKKQYFPLLLVSSLLMCGCTNKEAVQLFSNKNEHEMESGLLVTVHHSFFTFSAETTVTITGDITLASKKGSPITDEVTSIKLLNETNQEMVDIEVKGPTDSEIGLLISTYQYIREYSIKATITTSYYNDYQNYCFSFSIRETDFVYHLYSEKTNSCVSIGN